MQRDTTLHDAAKEWLQQRSTSTQPEVHVDWQAMLVNWNAMLLGKPANNTRSEAQRLHAGHLARRFMAEHHTGQRLASQSAKGIPIASAHIIDDQEKKWGPRPQPTNEDYEHLRMLTTSPNARQWALHFRRQWHIGWKRIPVRSPPEECRIARQGTRTFSAPPRKDTGGSESVAKCVFVAGECPGWVHFFKTGTKFRAGKVGPQTGPLRYKPVLHGPKN